MAANSDGADARPPWWLPLQRTTPPVRTLEEEDEAELIVLPSLDEAIVPSSLESISPILRAAKEIEEKNPRVAYLCRFTAYQKAHEMDPYSRGHGVQDFKTKLLHRLERDERETKRILAPTDSREVMRFHEQYRKEHERETKRKLVLAVDSYIEKKKSIFHSEDRTFYELRKEQKLEDHVKGIKEDNDWHYNEIASVLHDVLKAVTPERNHSEVDDETKVGKHSFSHYNILHFSDDTQPAMKIPEIIAAMKLLRRIDNLPKPRSDPTSASKVTHVAQDLFDWLGQAFGFQKGNVENQKEHLILLLANIDMRKGGNAHQSETQNHTIHSDRVTTLMRKTFHNYTSWCQYLHLESNIKIPRGNFTQQPELLYLGLYLLIWGEASNVRFMPECLCYIFHNMARDLYRIISRKDSFVPPITQGENDDAFLQQIIQPIFNVIQKEASRSKHGTASYSKWRNYDDLNEYFWSEKNLKLLKWPMDLTANFFANPMKPNSETEKDDHVVTRWRVPKTNFVELRTFFHLFRSFDRMWSLFILAFQAMVIIALSPSGSLSAILEPTVFRNVLTIFITDAFLNFVQATLDIAFNWKAWRSLECSQMIRYILKFAIALAWLIILPTTYISSIHDYSGPIKFFGSWIGSLLSQSSSIYNVAIVLYMLPNILSGFIFIFLPIQRALEHSNSPIIKCLLWWTQVKLYVARGMYDDMFSVLMYTLFWIVLLICKFTFSFYVEIFPLVGPTKKILPFESGTCAHEFHLNLSHNLGIVVSLWLPIAMIYFIDTQIWYTIFSTICGGVIGAFSGLGEIRTQGMLRRRFLSIPTAFGKTLVPTYGSEMRSEPEDLKKNHHTDEFSDVWNAFIISLRDEDLISYWETDLLLVPSFMAIGETTVFQWPLFIVANKIPFALNMAKDAQKEDEELIKTIRQDPYAYDAVIECYETLQNILFGLIDEPSDKEFFYKIRDHIRDSIHRQSFAKEYWLDKLPQLTAKFVKLLALLQIHPERDNMTAIVYQLQEISEFIVLDFLKNGQDIWKDESKRYFKKINVDFIKDRAWKEKFFRLQRLLATGASAGNIYIDAVPTNVEARRRMTFFANSLFMKMPRAPQVRSMMSFSVLTPHFKEEVLFSADNLRTVNDDGISMLFYLRKIYPDEWKNFLERIYFKPEKFSAYNLRRQNEYGISIPFDPQKIYPDERNNSILEDEESNNDEICLWASYRAQTLTRTVRGMMYYRRALEIQCIQEKADLDQLDHDKITESSLEARAIADIKFTYVVSSQLYGMHKESMEARDRDCYLNILNLMITYPSLRVAYIDEVPTENRRTEKNYYSVLVKGRGHDSDEEIYRIKLPGKPIDIEEGKHENQNHAIIFTRGEALQAIDMNQDNYIEEAFKMRNLLEFESERSGPRKPTILGLREHTFTGSVSSLAMFASNEEFSFVTIGQRVLANPLRVRFHYGRTDIFDRLFHITRGGISKASKNINLSGGIFSGFNSTMREGNTVHLEYMQVGKGRDAGMNEISLYEAHVANGYGEQTLSRDINRLGRRFDIYRMLSLYFTTVGFYFSSLVSVLTIFVFLYGRLYLVLTGLQKSIFLIQTTHENVQPLESALASQSMFHLGLLLVLPVFVEVGLEKGSSRALDVFFIMQLQLASVFVIFQLGTRAHYYGRTILHGRPKFRPTGRGPVVYHATFAENYRRYSRSHFVKGLELSILLVVYSAYGSCYRSSALHLFVTFSIWFLVVSWLFAPFIFNPLCFEKIADDWKDWKMWMGYTGGIGMSTDLSWESWWESEQEYLRKSSILAVLLEIILSFRFLIYQCGIIYYLNIERPRDGIQVYAVLWVFMFSVPVALKVDSYKFGTDLQPMIRILKPLVFFSSISAMVVVFIVYDLRISDVLVSILGFIPTGWFLLQMGQICSPLLKETMLWDSIVDLGRAYDNMMGLILFAPIIFLSWFRFVSVMHTHLLFNQGFVRRLQILRMLDGQKEEDKLIETMIRKHIKDLKQRADNDSETPQDGREEQPVMGRRFATKNFVPSFLTTTLG